MSGSKSKSPPQRTPKPASPRKAKTTAARKRSRRAAPAARPEQAPAMNTGLRTLDEVIEMKGTPIEGEQDYSVNALSKLTGKDRRTIDKAVVGIAPARVVGKTKYYRLLDVEAALKEKPGRSLRDEKLIEEIRKLRLANDVTEKSLITRASVKASMRRCLTPAAAMLEQRLVNEYPTGVAGLDVPQARIYGKRLCDELTGFLQAFEKEWA